VRTDASNADRKQAVRETARDWSRAGWIDENAFRAIENLYPDDRVRSGPAFRILFFALTLGAIAGAAGIASLMFRDQLAIAAIVLSAGLLCAGMTEYLTGPQRRRQGGIEAAFSLAAVIGVLVGLLLVTDKLGLSMDQHTLTLHLFAFAFVSGLAAWRWGYWPYAALAAYFGSTSIFMLPAGRLLWIAAVLAASRCLTMGSDSPTLPPSLRKSATAFLTVCLLALYAGVNVLGLDQGLSGLFFGLWSPSAGFFPRWMSIVMTAMLPPVIFAIGVIKRRRLFLNLGFLMAICSFATLRFYFHIVPPWTVFIGSGLLLFAAAAGLRRFLDSGEGGERGGFTAASLGEDPRKQRGMEELVGIATLTPGVAEPVQKSGMRGSGGEFGGGGASGDF